jgi:ABC-type sulfate transport system substrate-binding protein
MVKILIICMFLFAVVMNNCQAGAVILRDRKLGYMQMLYRKYGNDAKEIKKTVSKEAQHKRFLTAKIRTKWNDFIDHGKSDLVVTYENQAGEVLADRHKLFHYLKDGA